MRVDVLRLPQKVNYIFLITGIRPVSLKHRQLVCIDFSYVPTFQMALNNNPAASMFVIDTSAFPCFNLEEIDCSKLRSMFAAEWPGLPSPPRINISSRKVVNV